eukprot:GHVU01034225.1.p4 GENE.GHVU01034225.1~~GHVU01034225.1.p4  ORF type:complete len:100 (-),score=1.89 GHVU01034225.1:124-423(-)
MYRHDTMDGAVGSTRPGSRWSIVQSAVPGFVAYVCPEGVRGDGDGPAEIAVRQCLYNVRRCPCGCVCDTFPWRGVGAHALLAHTTDVPVEGVTGPAEGG